MTLSPSLSSTTERQAETRLFLEEVGRRLPLVEILRQDGVRLTRQGRTYRGPCPLHTGRNPNFVILPGGRRFYCHKCGVSGDVIDYLQGRSRNPVSSFRDVLIWLSEAAAVPLPQSDTDTLPTAEMLRDVARYPVALEFAVRFYQAARDANHDAFTRACAVLQVSEDIAKQCGAGFAPDANRLALNITRYCASEAWPVFHQLGLVDQRFGTSTSNNELIDRVPSGAVIWPVTDRGRLAGLVVLDMHGDRVYCTEPGHTVNPRFAVLSMPDGDFPWNVGDADPGIKQQADVATLWRDAPTFWHHSEAAPGPHVVPTWRWGSHQDAARVRTQLRGRSAVGAAITDDDLQWWANVSLLEWVDGIYDCRSGHWKDGGIRHPLEAVLAENAEFDATAAIAAISVPRKRLIMGGWLAQQSRTIRRVPLEPPGHSSSTTPSLANLDDGGMTA